VALRDVFTRSIRPPEQPNGNDPSASAPGTVGPPAVTPGDPDGIVITGDSGEGWRAPPRIVPSPWSGWPDGWEPVWETSGRRLLPGIAWTCVDLNANVLAAMPPYLLVDNPDQQAPPAAAWLDNPNPAIYGSWPEFAKQLFWDYMVGEAFVLATAYYATGWPSHFHVVPPQVISVELGPDGLRHYSIGKVDVTADICHVRYWSSVNQAHGYGPLASVASHIKASAALTQYGTALAAGGGIPPSILHHPEELSAEKSADLKAQWMAARASSMGEPAVLTGGVMHEVVAVNPKDMSMMELQQYHDAQIAVAFGVPPFLVGLPSAAGEPFTYKNINDLLNFHWRAHLRTRAQAVMATLSQFLLPRGTSIELNRDEYIAASPYERAQTYQILASIIDPVTGQPAMSVDEIRDAERLNEAATPQPKSGGVLK
jgi:HK97 family phage portal protein